VNRSHPWLITAGALVLAITNAVVLVGVASNRRQPPDSILTLTERELGPQWSWMWRDGENSGSGLRLQYRVESSRSSNSAQSGEDGPFSSYGSFGPIVWLDRDKLAALGFDVAQPLTSDDADTHYNRMLGRDVLLVLELEGPVHARALQAARDFLAHQEHDIAANPQRKETAERLRDAQRAVQREEHEASRLFIVDAGLDQTTLRQRYPDRTHYAIVNGNIRPYVVRDRTSARLYGAVTAVRCETINVPLQFRETVHPFILEVAFGTRLEPWIVSGHAGPT
jgi:hypothetical protein